MLIFRWSRVTEELFLGLLTIVSALCFQFNHINHFKYFNDSGTTTTASFSLTHFNHFKFFIDPLQPHQALRATFWYHFNYFLSSTYQYQLFRAKIFWKFNFLKNPLQPHQHLETHFGTTSTIFWVLHIIINYLEQENFENSTFWKTHFNHIGI